VVWNPAKPIIHIGPALHPVSALCLPLMVGIAKDDHISRTKTIKDGLIAAEDQFMRCLFIQTGI